MQFTSHQGIASKLSTSNNGLLDLCTLSSIRVDFNSSPLFLSKRNQKMSKAASGTGPIAGDRKPPETRRQAQPVPSRASENSRTHHESETRPSNRSGDIFISHGQRSPPKARSRLLQPIHPQRPPRPRAVQILGGLVTGLEPMAEPPENPEFQHIFGQQARRHPRVAAAEGGGAGGVRPKM
ncbi:hypothetical protein LOK49_LG03G01171 [Camellia lanceoleosa]|uniref:Uncharacterized protein n=1 Tax=Camellia lanceoleosa TaxID=1840588 RepID=A0ACC0I8I8_9ERIC|nr:hypothetical protein LOK49_LG03G01171 [Camellia lanceoleosa]